MDVKKGARAAADAIVLLRTRRCEDDLEVAQCGRLGWHPVSHVSSQVWSRRAGVRAVIDSARGAIDDTARVLSDA